MILRVADRLALVVTASISRCGAAQRPLPTHVPWPLHFTQSVGAGFPLYDLLPAVRAAGRGDMVLTGGFSCRTQLADLAGHRGLHLLPRAHRRPRRDWAVIRMSLH